ncbi:hypothetical protein NL676_021285 [Syzygium grande]|nr:hypothetical protein NL676_021285 [Syzygium grande]
MTINVQMLSTQKNLLVETRNWDTIQDVKSMIQAKEGILPDEFNLFFSGEVKEVKNKLLRKLQESALAKLHDIAHVGQRLADDCDLASYHIQENSTLFGIVSPHSKSKA